MSESSRSNDVSVLHVDDEPGYAEMTVSFLENISDRIDGTAVTDPTEAADLLGQRQYDCVVSDHQMPSMTGVELLKHVREHYGDLPFILFTGAGSEKVAQQAIENDVTSYLSKEAHSDQYEVLVDKIISAVDEYRNQQQIESRARAVDTIQQGISILDQNGIFQYVSDAYADIYGYDPDELVGKHWQITYPEEDVDFIEEVVMDAVQKDGQWHGQTTGKRANGETFIEDHIVAETEDGRVICSVKDITGEVDNRQELQLKTKALDEAPVGIVILDARRDHNPFIYANQAFTEITGYTDGEIKGKSLDILHGDGTEREPVKKLSEAISAGDEVEVVVRSYRKDGTAFWNRMSISPIRDDNGDVEYFVCFQMDVTEQREREYDLARERTVRETIIDALPDVFYLYDTSGNFHRWNDALGSLTGYEDDEITDMHPADLIAPEDCADHLEGSEKLLTGEIETHTLETELLTRDEERIPFEMSCSHIEFPGDGDGDRIVCIGRDISHRKELEEELRKDREDLREMVAVASNTDVDFEEKLEQLLEVGTVHFSADVGFIAKSVDDGYSIVTTTGDDINGTIAEFETRAADEMDGVVTSTYDGRQLFAHPLTIEGTVYGLLGFISDSETEYDDGSYVFFRLLSRWISHQFEQNHRIQQLSEHKEFLQDFSAIVSHDIRSPLTTAQTHAKQVADEYRGEHIDHLQTALDRIDNIIDETLTLVRSGQNTRSEPISLPDIAIQSWHIAPTDEATIEIEADKEILGNSDTLPNLFENLFRNSVEHGGEDVHVRVGELPGGFYVEDDGPGIPEEHRNRVFEPGISTTDGTGLGLAIVRRIAAAHGWDVTVEDSDLGGVRFTFTDVETTTKPDHVQIEMN